MASVQQVLSARGSAALDLPAAARDRTRHRLHGDTAVSSRPPVFLANVIPLRRRRPPRANAVQPPVAALESTRPVDETAEELPARPRRRTGKRLILTTVPVAGMARTPDGRGLVIDSEG